MMPLILSLVPNAAKVCDPPLLLERHLVLHLARISAKRRNATIAKSGGLHQGDDLLLHELSKEQTFSAGAVTNYYRTE